jgi:two-component system response regulator PhoP
LVRLAGVVPSAALPDSPAAGHARPSSTVLIIEDDAVVRVIVRRHLEADGYLVLEAVDGHSGLELIDTHEGPLDLVLTDIGMPRIDGITVAEVLAALRPLLGVVCMSAGMAESRFVERLALRPHPFLAKPFTRETLVLALGAELARSRELASRVRSGETVGRDGAPEEAQARVAAVGLVAAAQRLQQGHIRNGSTTKGISPQANGRPLASEEKS